MPGRPLDIETAINRLSWHWHWSGEAGAITSALSSPRQLDCSLVAPMQRTVANQRLCLAASKRHLTLPQPTCPSSKPKTNRLPTGAMQLHCLDCTNPIDVYSFSQFFFFAIAVSTRSRHAHITRHRNRIQSNLIGYFIFIVFESTPIPTLVGIQSNSIQFDSNLHFFPMNTQNHSLLTRNEIKPN